jgi:hypothetical protein
MNAPNIDGAYINLYRLPVGDVEAIKMFLGRKNYVLKLLRRIPGIEQAWYSFHNNQIELWSTKDDKSSFITARNFIQDRLIKISRNRDLSFQLQIMNENPYFVLLLIHRKIDDSSAYPPMPIFTRQQAVYKN